MAKGQESDDDMARDHQEAWERTIEMLDTSDIKGKTILDVGCNQGGFLRKLYDTTPFKEGVGIDLARLSLEKAETLKGERPLTYYLTDKPQETNRTFDTAYICPVLNRRHSTTCTRFKRSVETGRRLLCFIRRFNQ